METFYLIDFENVHNDGIANIESITKEEHVHIFSTQNATNIRQDIFWLKEDRDIKPHLVPVRKQSLDMHLVSYLGYLLGVYGKECSYVIISKDKDYDNIVKFWKEEGYPNISRKEKWPGTASTQRQKTQTVSQTKSNVQTVNSKISAGMAYEFEGDDRSELNLCLCIDDDVNCHVFLGKFIYVYMTISCSCLDHWHCRILYNTLNESCTTSWNQNI
jgi:hypothetical protein